MSAAILKVSLVAGATFGAIASSSALRAEEQSTAPHDRRTLLSVYDPPSTRSAISPVAAPPLLREVAQAREHVQHLARTARTVTEESIGRFITFESALQESALSIASPEEKLNPGALYVGVATLSASILARNRGLFLRTLAPPTFLALSLAYFLPLTAARAASAVSTIESQYFPRFAAQHDRFNEHLIKGTGEATSIVEQSVRPAIEQLRLHFDGESGRGKRA